MSPDPTRDRIHEICFTGALLLAGGGFVAAALLTPVDESAAFNSRALPLAVAFGIIACSAVRLALLSRSLRGHRVHGVGGGGISTRVVVPLSAAMVAYVALVQLLGYLAGTALVLIAVQWIFGTRDLRPILAVAVVVAVVADILFIGLLGVFMPDGWLPEQVQEWTRASARTPP